MHNIIAFVIFYFLFREDKRLQNIFRTQGELIQGIPQERLEFSESDLVLLSVAAKLSFWGIDEALIAFKVGREDALKFSLKFSYLIQGQVQQIILALLLFLLLIQ